MVNSPPDSFSNFDFTYDTTLFPHPPPLPPSSDLFSASETTQILGFLDNFSDIAWDFGVADYDLELSQPSVAPYSNPHLNTTPGPSTSSRLRSATRSASVRPTPQIQDDRQLSTPSTPNISSPSESTVPSPSRSRPLLSTPQKRLNHIMSEQKRRNAIRDGYAQLITLLAPVGAPGIDMPTRGRPKGSGSHGKGQTKGKSGVLFRAVEYCRWLEEGRNALRAEVLRVEAAAGIHH